MEELILLENVLKTVGRYYLKQMKGSNAGGHSEIWKHFMVSDLHAWLILISHFSLFPPALRLEINAPLKKQVTIKISLFFLIEMNIFINRIRLDPQVCC